MVKVLYSPGDARRAQGTKGPDFIIGGAMKAATTTLHHILAQHEGIFIPPGELNFFSSDDVIEHPERLAEISAGSAGLESRDGGTPSLDAYLASFDDADPKQLVGEDSTVYLASELVPSRLATAYPQVKLLFILRDPVERCFSHYWHLVRTGVAVHGFDRTLCYHPELLVRRGLYKRQLGRYLLHFRRERLKILIFEDFTRNIERSYEGILDFLGVESQPLASNSLRVNAGRYPRSPRTQYAWNRTYRWGRGLTVGRHTRTPLHSPLRERSGLHSVDAVVRRLNVTATRTPSMRAETRRALERYFLRENAGLNELLGLDLEQFWPWFEQ